MSDPQWCAQTQGMGGSVLTMDETVTGGARRGGGDQASVQFMLLEEG
jgi:hypothetical protein